MAKKKPSNKKGMILFILLATMLVAAILTNVISNIVVSHARFAEHQVNRVKAYYVALGALNLTFENLRKGVWATTPTSPDTPYTFCKTASCSVEDPELPYTVEVRITDPDGTTGLRTITLNVDYTYTPAESP